MKLKEQLRKNSPEINSFERKHHVTSALKGLVSRPQPLFYLDSFFCVGLLFPFIVCFPLCNMLTIFGLLSHGPRSHCCREQNAEHKNPSD